MPLLLLGKPSLPPQRTLCSRVHLRPAGTLNHLSPAPLAPLATPPHHRLQVMLLLPFQTLAPTLPLPEKGHHQSRSARRDAVERNQRVVLPNRQCRRLVSCSLQPSTSTAIGNHHLQRRDWTRTSTLPWHLKCLSCNKDIPYKFPRPASQPSTRATAITAVTKASVKAPRPQSATGGLR